MPGKRGKPNLDIFHLQTRDFIITSNISDCNPTAQAHYSRLAADSVSKSDWSLQTDPREDEQNTIVAVQSFAANRRKKEGMANQEEER